MEAIDAAPAVVCGHSLGGPLAVRLGLNHPGATSRLVLVGPSGLRPAPAWQSRALALLPAYLLLRRAPVPWERWLLRVAPLRRAALRPLVDDPSSVSLAMARTIVEGGREARELQRAAAASFARTGLGARGARGRGADRGDLGRPRPHGAAGRRRRCCCGPCPPRRSTLLPACGHLPRVVERPHAFAALLARLAAG